MFVKSIFDDKSNPKFRLWNKPECDFEDDEIIFHAPFAKKKSHDSDEMEERIYFLTKSYIFYKKSLEDSQVRSVLDLKMTRLHYTEHELPVWDAYKYSLTFIRNRKFTEIFTDNHEVFKEWIQVLRLLTIQTDFHARYKVDKMIGKGSFARVWLAQNTETGEKVAIKAFIKEQILQKKKGVESMTEEIEVTWNLNCKNIVKMIELHETENSLYMVLELLEGGEIFKLQGGSIQYDITIFIIHELLKAAVYLDKHRIMHRDLKPENIVLKYKGVPIKENVIKIVDFGLSAYKDDQSHCFVKCGTPGYAAPEVINSVSESVIDYDTKCDIFSLGIIFFFMITGVMPYDGPDFESVLSNNKKGVINFDIPQLFHQPKVVLDLLKGMLQLQPSKRLSAQEAINSPVFQAGGISDLNKYTSCEDLDTQLRKFKEKFRKRDQQGTTDSLHFNTHPDQHNGIDTYQNLSEQSMGSNKYVNSIDGNKDNGPDTPESGSAKSGKSGHSGKSATSAKATGHHGQKIQDKAVSKLPGPSTFKTTNPPDPAIDKTNSKQVYPVPQSKPGISKLASMDSKVNASILKQKYNKDKARFAEEMMDDYEED